MGACASNVFWNGVWKRVIASRLPSLPEGSSTFVRAVGRGVHALPLQIWLIFSQLR
jgi:hypothetical protein